MKLSTVVGAALALTVSACGSSITGSDKTAAIPAGTHRSAITALTGPGAGGVSVTPNSIPAGTFDADIVVSIERARPNTTYFVQRAPEVGRALGSDGTCQRSAGLSPWSTADPPAPAFVTFQLPSGPDAWLTTGLDGSASLTFEFQAPAILAGTQFDVMFRLIDSFAAPTTELRSGCFTVLVK